MSRDAATERQVRAADPDASTWVEANAGSGKTRVLTDRVARLLLGGTDPRHILCLTYTKAAASEMQNRLFRRLGAWAMLPAGELTEQLQALGASGPLTATRLAEARRLFARAIETPGGLRIQTIHAFCASVLRRFPLEAGLSPQFAEMEQRDAELLQAEVADEIAVERPDLMRGVAPLAAADSLKVLLDDIVTRRALFGGVPSRASIAAALGLDPDLDEAGLVGRTFPAGARALLAALARICADGSQTDQKLARLLEALPDPLGLREIETLEGPFLFGAKTKVPFGAKVGAVPTRETRGRDPGLCERLDALMERIEAARTDRLRLRAARESAAVALFGAEFLARYEAAKLARGLVDFDDLIGRTRALLENEHVAAWVLFRLDGGIDHILVDESQDTSPGQWAVVRQLAREFTAGEGAAPGRRRTIFVVGDRKQSIYSFQGADPVEFDRTATHFETRLGEAGQRLQKVALEHSFRSAVEVLRAVDDTFTTGRSAGLGDPPGHIAFKETMPGRVDLWPPVPAADRPEEPPWHEPVDQLGRDDPKVVLARQIAAEIARMTREEWLPVETGEEYGRRRVRPGDVLILVRGRKSGLFENIIRSCKEAGLPVAGADRLKLMAELAVRDLVAVLKFLSLAEDDLALASALRSPLFGWNEAQLHGLAAGRGRATLWQRLRASPCEALSILRDLRERSDFLRPYDLLHRLLLRHDGRRRLLARLGREAEDGIDQLLAQALAYERRGVPSLTGFLEWLETEEIEVKRQAESAGDQIRVMTVHGAKGLEAPIVILPDTGTRPARARGRIFDIGGVPIWSGIVDELPEDLAVIRQERVVADEREQRRLLYVAMTRAERWLIVCAAGDAKEGEGSWHGMVADGLRHGPSVEHTFPTGKGLRVERPGWDALPLAAASEAPRALPEAAPVFGPAPPPARARLLSPSDLGGAKVLPGETEDIDPEESLALGRLVHMLLETLPSLPVARREAAGLALVETHPDGPAAADPAALVGEVGTLLARPDLAPLFVAGALAEVPLSAPAGRGEERLVGIVDRLIVADDHVLAVDYKTNRRVPDRAEEVPEGLLRQMGAYDHALRAIFPDRRVETALLWTRTGLCMRLPQHLVQAAYGRAMAALTPSDPALS